VTGEQGAHTRANGDTGAGAAVAVAVVMVVVVVVVLGGEGGCAIYFVQNHLTLSQRDSSLRKNLDTCSNSACALEGHVDWQKGRIMAVRPACAFCRAGAAGPSKRYSDMLLDTTTPLLW
jgi:hypothetical protein